MEVNVLQTVKTLFKSNRKKILIVVALLVFVGFLLLKVKTNYKMRVDVNEIIDLASVSQINDTTTQHISNMSESYQILPNKILYLSGEQKKGANLCQTDRKGNGFKKIAGDVTSFLEYEGKVYYRISSEHALYRYDSDNDRKECLLEEGVEWFTVYEGNILIMGEESIKFYNLQKETTETVVDYYPFGYPFYAERIGDYIILCDNNVHLFSIKEKEDTLLLERWALSFDDITVYENKVYIRMQKYFIKNYDDIIFDDESWNGIWCLDIELYEKDKDNTGFEKLSEEQIEDLLNSGEIPQSSNLYEK